MKKLMLSLCALCLVGAASAQVSRLSLSEKVQRMQKFQPAIFEAQNLDMQVEESMPVHKAAKGLDSVLTQCAYGGFTLSEECFFWFPYPGQNDQSDPCYEDKFAFALGTGGFPSMAGTGELGYRFDAGRESWYQFENHYPNLGVPYAAQTLLLRFPSTSLRHTREDGEVYYDSMPLYFKVYNSSKVNEQQVADLANETSRVYLDVVYPTDPEDYTAISETIMVEAHDCDLSADNKIILHELRLQAEFLDIDASQRLGDNFCVSMVFPIEWDEEGDSVIDPRWNTVPWTIGDTWMGPGKISATPHCTYLVHDFRRTTDMWWESNQRPKDYKRPDYFVLDSAMQPNMRYAVMPMDGLGTATSTIKAEPYFKLYFTEWSALESANKADRYVQVSPVPAVDYVNFTSYANMSRIEIYSLNGKLVKTVNVSGDTYRMDIAGLTSGMYVARIYSEKGISSKKLIIR